MTKLDMALYSIIIAAAVVGVWAIIREIRK
jgi:hypothetical protein